jgi:ABC-type branched-subunit amino acid transport system substrate-binding protein
VNGTTKINLELFDSQGAVPTALDAFQRALASKPTVLVASTIGMTGALPQIEQSGIPLVTNVATNAFIYPPKPYLFEPTATAKDTAIAQINFAKTLLGGSIKGKTIGLFYTDAPAINTQVLATEELAKTEGFTIASKQSMTPGSISATAQAGEIARAKPDVVIAQNSPVDSPVALDAMLTAGIKQPIVGSTGGSTPTIFERFKASNYYGPRDAHLGSELPELVTAAGKFGTSGHTNSIFFSHGWIFGHLVAQAIKGCLPDCTNASLTKALTGLSSVSIPGNPGFGPLSFSETRHDGLSKVQFYVWDGTKTAASGSPIDAKAK